MKDDELEPALKQWEVELPADPQFRSSVWREIAMRDAASSATRFNDALDRLFTPRFAVPVVAAAVVAVMLTATLHGEQSRQRAWSDLATAYSSAIDPVAHTEMMATIAEPRSSGRHD